MRRLTLILVTLLAVAAGLLTALPADASTTTAKSLLAKLTVHAEAGGSTYVRRAFRYPTDTDRDACDTREEVLIAEATRRLSPGAGCRITSGRWLSTYDGRTWTRASDVSIDHMVPFREAWESGARRWSATDRARFANDLGLSWVLNVMTDDLKLAKGARDPASWLPPRAKCAYAKHWVAVKYRWRLTVDRAEKVRLAAVLTGSCGAKTLTVPRRAIAVTSAPAPSAPATPTPAPPPVTSVASLNPVADSFVNATQPTTTGGTSGSLGAYGSPDVQAYLRFTLPPLANGQSLVGASLRLTTTAIPTAGSADRQQVVQVADAWDESTVTWNTRPATVGAVLGSAAAANAPVTSFEIPLGPAGVSALLGRSATLGVFGTGSDSLWFASRESPTAAHRPVLTLRFTGSVTADATPPAAPGVPSTSVSGSTVTVSWGAGTDNVGVTSYDVHRSAASGFVPTDATLVGRPGGTTFTDAGRPAGTAYYRVVARDAAGNASAPSAQAAATVSVAGAVTVMAVGDIACPPGSAVTARTCRHGEVGGVVSRSGANFFIPLGDLQYQNATYDDFVGAGAYNSALGAVKAQTLPVLGNHEHTDPGGISKGYFDYFYGPGVHDGALGARGAGYYTRNIGSWQFIGLNSECLPDAANGGRPVAGGCGVGSPQYEWLRSVLSSSSARCTLVAFHRPRWSTGSHGPYAPLSDLWDLMARSGVDVTLSGHNHSTEIFQRIGASGNGITPVLDPAGIRSFVAGGGGKDLYSSTAGSTAATGALQARDVTTFGPLRLTLKDGSFDWAYTPIPGQTFTNAAGTSGAFSGVGEACH